MMPPTLEPTQEATIEQKPLPAIWNAPDPLWELVEKILAVYDPPNRMGCPRADARHSYDGIIYRLRTGQGFTGGPMEPSSAGVR